ncbi:MAG: hypothetical protein II750_00365 [Bacteroidaceae bacterium]|nr:hypothetical protein [Bacteroidaceae bacterium]
MTEIHIRHKFTMMLYLAMTSMGWAQNVVPTYQLDSIIRNDDLNLKKIAYRYDNIGNVTMKKYYIKRNNVWLLCDSTVYTYIGNNKTSATLYGIEEDEVVPFSLTEYYYNNGVLYKETKYSFAASTWLPIQEKDYEYTDDMISIERTYSLEKGRKSLVTTTQYSYNDGLLRSKQTDHHLGDGTTNPCMRWIYTWSDGTTPKCTQIKICEYNLHQWQISEQDTFIYDEAGVLIGKYDEVGWGNGVIDFIQKTEFCYDISGNIISIRYYNKTGKNAWQPVYDTHFMYNSNIPLDNIVNTTLVRELWGIDIGIPTHSFAIQHCNNMPTAIVTLDAPHPDNIDEYTQYYYSILEE